MSSNKFYGNEVEVTFLSNYPDVTPEGKEAIIIRTPFSYDDCKFKTREKYLECS